MKGVRGECGGRAIARNRGSASKDGFEYFITAFSMDGPPWESEASSPKGTENYLNSLRDFASSIIPSYSK